MKFKVFNKETGEEIKDAWLSQEGKCYKCENIEGVFLQLEELDPTKYTVCKFTGFYTADNQEIYENMRLTYKGDGRTYPIIFKEGRFNWGSASVAVLDQEERKIMGWEFDGKFFPLGHKNAPSETNCTKSHQEDSIVQELQPEADPELKPWIPPSKKIFGEMMEEAYGKRFEKLETQIKELIEVTHSERNKIEKLEERKEIEKIFKITIYLEKQNNEERS